MLDTSNYTCINRDALSDISSQSIQRATIELALRRKTMPGLQREQTRGMRDDWNEQWTDDYQ